MAKKQNRGQGALADMVIWLGVAESGVDYMVLRAGDERYVGFYNTKKKHDKQPDWRIFKDTGEDKLEAVGAAWEGETKDGKDMLFIKINDGDQERTFRGYVNTKKVSDDDKKPNLICFEIKDEQKVEDKEDTEDKEPVQQEEAVEEAVEKQAKASTKSRFSRRRGR